MKCPKCGNGKFIVEQIVEEYDFIEKIVRFVKAKEILGNARDSSIYFVCNKCGEMFKFNEIKEDKDKEKQFVSMGDLS